MQTSTPDRPSNFLTEPADRGDRPPLIVFSHLRWGFVFQRPQHLLTRLAQHFDVHFVEEPVFADAEPALMSATHQNGVEVLTPRTREFASGFHDSQIDAMKPLIADFMASRGLKEPLVWLYTPMALPLVADLEPRAVVYDCMDDLASFKFAPLEMAAREKALMDLADVVLTGGPSLYEARVGRHPNLHCLPSAVDAAHFAPENLDGDDVEAAVATELHRGMAHPRLGFFGVIDERLDLALVEALADLRPDWQIVMAGPVVKIDPANLPQRPNIRWIGMQRYEALPHLMSHWDVCLLPFALNEATRFISPTKTLEYLAGGKPVVSTPIRDVVSLYGSAVRFGENAREFVAAVEEILGEHAPERARRRARGQALVDACTWDGTAAVIAAMLLEYAPRAPAEPIVLHEALADSDPLVAARDDLAGIPVLTDRVDLPAQPLPM
jgi:glycosyltransferase involved in cell wall biosynthesis